MDDTKSIIEKIRKLLALSTSSNPNEAANATAAARRLLLKHGLEMEQIQQETEEIKQTLWRQRRIEAHTLQIIFAVTKFNMCAHLLNESGIHYIVGTEAHKASCMVMLDYLFEAMERSVSEALKRRKNQAAVTQNSFWQVIEPIQSSTEWSRSYRIGWAAQMQIRLDISKEEDSSEEKALVVVQDSRVKDFMSQFSDKIDFTVKSPQNSEGFRDGFQDAISVPLHKQVGEQQ